MHIFKLCSCEFWDGLCIVICFLALLVFCLLCVPLLCSWSPHLPCISPVALLPVSSPTNQLPACSRLLLPVPCCFIFFILVCFLVPVFSLVLLHALFYVDQFCSVLCCLHSNQTKVMLQHYSACALLHFSPPALLHISVTDMLVAAGILETLH